MACRLTAGQAPVSAGAHAVPQAWLKSSMASGDGGGAGTVEAMLPSEKVEQDRLDRVKQLTGGRPLPKLEDSLLEFTLASWPHEPRRQWS